MRKIGIISGKGGTGKTTVAISLANALVQKGFRVALLDVDLTGPNITDVLHKSELEVENDKFIPSTDKGLKYVSLGQIASEGDPVLWEGKDLREAASQLFSRTRWGPTDYLIVDFPPGTGPEAQVLLPEMDFVIVVTVPSVLSQSNVTRMIEMMRETQTPIIGLIKNMTKFVCPECDHEHTIFPEDHNFENIDIPTLAEIPLNPKIALEKVINGFPVDKVLEAIKNPIILKRHDKSMKRIMLEALFRGGS